MVSNYLILADSLVQLYGFLLRAGYWLSDDGNQKIMRADGAIETPINDK